MNALLLIVVPILALSTDPGTCPLHAQHMAEQHSAGVDERGDRVMGFSHEKTKHTFVLHKDGGAVEVRGNDEESVAAIRTHLKEIANDFTASNFTKPQAIHGRTPDGIPVMKELASRITYTYEELEGGARVRIKTTDARALEAVHEFLRFQIEDHRTGDGKDVAHH
jgi:hypothetical protein